MRKTFLGIWALSLLLGTAALPWLTKHYGTLAWASGFEAIHILAHLILYGSLTAMCLRVGWRVRRATVFVALVACLQEGIQLMSAGRGPGFPELWDLCVDGFAVAIVSVLFAKSRQQLLKAGQPWSASGPILHRP